MEKRRGIGPIKEVLYWGFLVFSFFNWVWVANTWAEDICAINSRWTLDCKTEDGTQFCAFMPGGKYSEADPLFSSTICSSNDPDKAPFILEAMKENAAFADVVWNYQFELDEIVCWELSGQEHQGCRAPVAFLLELLEQLPVSNESDGNLEDILDFAQDWLDFHGEPQESTSNASPYGERDFADQGNPMGPSIVDIPMAENPKQKVAEVLDQFRSEVCGHQCFLEKEQALQKLLWDTMGVLAFYQLPERIQLYCLLQDIYLGCESGFIEGVEALGRVYDFINDDEPEIETLSCPIE